MENLNHLLPGDPISALVPTSQHGGNQVWANNAMTAPGGPSGDLGNDLGQAVVVPPPAIEAIDYTDSPVEVNPGGAQVHASHEDHGDPYSSGDGGGWKVKVKIVAGRWNSL